MYAVKMWLTFATVPFLSEHGHYLRIFIGNFGVGFLFNTLWNDAEESMAGKRKRFPVIFFHDRVCRSPLARGPPTGLRNRTGSWGPWGDARTALYLP